MICHWEHKTVAFEHKGKMIKLQRVREGNAIVLKEVQAEQLLKWERGNEVWATAMVYPPADPEGSEVPVEIQEVLHQYEEVFKEPTNIPPTGSLAMQYHWYPG